MATKWLATKAVPASTTQTPYVPVSGDRQAGRPGRYAGQDARDHQFGVAGRVATRQ